MIAAPVFAEITVSGDVEMMYSYDLAGDDGMETFGDDAGNSVSLDLGIAIGEFTTLNATLDADAEFYDEQDSDNDSDPTVTLGGWSVTQDVTGALGLDGMVTFTAEMGDVSFSGMQYTDELDALTDSDNDYGTDMDGSYFDYLLTFGLMDMITVEFGVFPLSYSSDALSGADGQFGVNVYGVFGPASVASYLAINSGMVDMAINGALDFSPVTAGFQFQIRDLEADIDADMESYVYVTYTSDFGLEATLEYYGYTMLTDMDMDLAADAAYTIAIAEGMTADADFGASNILEADGSELTFNAGVGVSYAMSTIVELHANFDCNNITNEAADNLELNVGTTLSIDSMTYSLDYTMDTDGETDYLSSDDTIHQIMFLATASF
jgi:hypothetical protein